MAKSESLRNATLDAILGSSQTLSAATLYLALYTVAPTESGGGTEATGGSYARLSVANTDTTFPAATGGAKSNAVALTFATPTASWGTVVAWGLHDHATNDSLVLWGTLDESVVIDSGDSVQFGVGELSFDEE